MALEPQERKVTEVTIAAVDALATTASLVVDDDRRKANTAIGNDFIRGIVRVFAPRGDTPDPADVRAALMKASRREIIDRIEPRLDEPIEEYPLGAVLADMERYDHAGTEGVATVL